MGLMIDQHKSFEKTLSEFRIWVPYEKEYAEYFKSLEYQQGSGSAAYEDNIKSYCVHPFAKIYYRDTTKPNVRVEQKTITYNVLESSLKIQV